MSLILIGSKPTFLSIIIPLFLSPLSLSKAQPTTNHHRKPYTSPDPINTTVTVALYIVAFVLVYFAFYYWVNHFFRRPAPAQLSPEEPVLTRGLDPSVLSTFPVFMYSEVAGGLERAEASECAVCLSPFEGDETLRLLPKCDHVFHVDCVDTWLASHSTCPYCRAELEPRPAPGGSVPDEVGEVNGVREEYDVVVVEASHEEEGEGNGGKGKFWRWNSTGHVAKEDRVGMAREERFVLRLPEELRNDIITGRLSRSRSCIIKSPTTVDVV